MKYQVNQTSGAWVRADGLTATSAKIVSETKPQPSSFTNKDGSPKTQDVCKVRFEGASEAVNVSLNRATIAGLVQAFGEESADWQGHFLKVETERMRVAGKAVTALYLIPEGYERIDDNNGYAVIVKKDDNKDVNAQMQMDVNDIPTIDAYPDR